MRIRNADGSEVSACEWTLSAPRSTVRFCANCALSLIFHFRLAAPRMVAPVRPVAVVLLRTGVVLDTGESVTPELVHRVIEEEVAGIGELDRLDDARRLFEQVALAEDFPDFLTLPAYSLID